VTTVPTATVAYRLQEIYDRPATQVYMIEREEADVKHQDLDKQGGWSPDASASNGRYYFQVLLGGNRYLIPDGPAVIRFLATSQAPPMWQLAKAAEEYVATTTNDVKFGSTAISGRGTASLCSASPLTILRNEPQMSQSMMAWVQGHYVAFRQQHRIYSWFFGNAHGDHDVPNVDSQVYSDDALALDLANSTIPIKDPYATPRWRKNPVTGEWEMELVHRNRYSIPPLSRDNY
jgi:hypothetical protein